VCMGLAFISILLLLLFYFIAPRPYTGLYQSLTLPIFSFGSCHSL